MEICGWDHGQRMDKGTYALVPPTWDTISELYKQVVKFVSHFPFKKRLVLYFVFRGTSVKVDLGDGEYLYNLHTSFTGSNTYISLSVVVMRYTASKQSPSQHLCLIVMQMS